MLPTKFQVNYPFGSGKEEAKMIFKMATRRPSSISDQNDFIYFYLQVTLMLHIRFQVSKPFRSGKEAKNRFSIWPIWISDRNDFSYF